MCSRIGFFWGGAIKGVGNGVFHGTFPQLQGSLEACLKTQPVVSS